MFVRNAAHAVQAAGADLPCSVPCQQRNEARVRAKRRVEAACAEIAAAPKAIRKQLFECCAPYRRAQVLYAAGALVL